jgi:peptidoglycan/LPS O-acetylase OafA/YrhL
MSNSDIRLEGLDTIRFIAALWVAISHGAVPLKPLADLPVLKMLLGAFLMRRYLRVGIPLAR